MKDIASQYNFLEEGNKNAKCPIISEFLDECLGAERKQEFLTLCALIASKERPFGRIYVFLGNAMTGKSIASRIISEFVGEENYSTWKLLETNSNRTSFARANDLKRVSVNIGDAWPNMKLDSGFIKSAVEGELGNPQVMILTCQLKPVQIKLEHGLRTRSKILEFKHSDVIAEKSEYIEYADIKAEMPGFRNLVCDKGIPSFESLFGVF